MNCYFMFINSCLSFYFLSLHVFDTILLNTTHDLRKFIFIKNFNRNTNVLFSSCTSMFQSSTTLPCPYLRHSLLSSRKDHPVPSCGFDLTPTSRFFGWLVSLTLVKKWDKNLDLQRNSYREKITLLCCLRTSPLSHPPLTYYSLTNHPCDI